MTTYSKNETIIGKNATEFFPNSYWKKFKFVDNVGHFLHIEAPDVCKETIKELLTVPEFNNHLN